MCFTHKNFAKVLNQYHYHFNTGDIIAGTIFSKEKYGYLVDIGAKNAAYLPNEEIQVVNKLSSEIGSNNTQEFFILASNHESKQLIISLKRIKYIRSWDRIKQIKNEDMILPVEVKSINKGGAIIEMENIRGFIPNSHLAYMASKDSLINTKILCKLLIANEQCNQLVLSNRCAILENMIDQIKIGLKIKAPITAIKPYGIFFNIYQIPALMHVSEIRKTSFYNLHKVFKIGEEWTIQIMHIDIKQGRLSVSVPSNKE
jgi:small subunit ribosomal protein S1